MNKSILLATLSSILLLSGCVTLEEGMNNILKVNCSMGYKISCDEIAKKEKIETEKAQVTESDRPYYLYYTTLPLERRVTSTLTTHNKSKNNTKTKNPQTTAKTTTKQNSNNSISKQPQPINNKNNSNSNINKNKSSNNSKHMMI